MVVHRQVNEDSGVTQTAFRDDVPKREADTTKENAPPANQAPAGNMANIVEGPAKNVEANVTMADDQERDNRKQEDKAPVPVVANTDTKKDTAKVKKAADQGEGQDGQAAVPCDAQWAAVVAAEKSGDSSTALAKLAAFESSPCGSSVGASKRKLVRGRLLVKLGKRSEAKPVLESIPKSADEGSEAEILLEDLK